MQNCLRLLGGKKNANKLYYGKCGNGEYYFPLQNIKTVTHFCHGY